MSKPLNVFVSESFTGKDDKAQVQYHKVGVAFPHAKGDGFNIKLVPGVAVSGDLVVFPPKDANDPKN